MQIWFITAIVIACLMFLALFIKPVLLKLRPGLFYRYKVYFDNFSCDTETKFKRWSQGEWYYYEKDKPFHKNPNRSYFDNGVETWHWDYEDTEALEIKAPYKSLSPSEVDERMKMVQSHFWDVNSYQELMKWLVIAAIGAALISGIVGFYFGNQNHEALKAIAEKLGVELAK